ncbi:MAG: 50S ribosomal protein L9 [Acidobacteriota bacterium]
MDVILRDHIDNLGNRGDIVKVADGYARNYLLPRKLALPATPANMKIVERQRKIAEAHEAAERSDAEGIAARLTQAECVMQRRVGEQDTLYGSVTSADIAADLATQGFEIEKRKIQLDEPIKTVGEFTVPIKLYRGVVAQLRVRVTPLATQEHEAKPEHG